MLYLRHIFVLITFRCVLITLCSKLIHRKAVPISETAFSLRLCQTLTSRSSSSCPTCSRSIAGTCSSVLRPLIIRVAYTTAISCTSFHNKISSSHIRILHIDRFLQQRFDIGPPRCGHVVNRFQALLDKASIDFSHTNHSFCCILPAHMVKSEQKGCAYSIVSLNYIPSTAWWKRMGNAAWTKRRSWKT